MRRYELSRRLTRVEAGVSRIAPRSSWFSDRCAAPFGIVRLMPISPGVDSDRSGPMVLL